MEDDRFVLFPRTQKGSDTWYCYIYDQNGNRKYRSTGTSNKAKARAYVLKKYRDGTLFEFKAKEVLFKDFAKPFWIWETCPIVNFKIKRGGTLAKGYCRSSRFLLDQKIIPAFGDKPIDFQFINMRLHKVLEANGIDWRRKPSLTITYVGYDTAQDKCIERDWRPEGEEQPYDLRSVRQSEVQYGNRVFWCRWYYVDPVGDEPRTRIREFCLIGEKQERCCRKLSLKRLKRSFMDKWRSKRLLVRTP